MPDTPEDLAARRSLMLSRMVDTEDFTMLAAWPVAPRLLATDAPGAEPPEELHVTLGFLGRTDDLDGYLKLSAFTAALVAAAGSDEIVATITGAGQLGEDDATVVYLESPDLDAVHAAVWRILDDEAPDEYPEQFAPWRPHLTIGYGLGNPELVAAAEALVGQTVTLGFVGVAFSGDQARFRLGPEDPTVGMSATVGSWGDAPLTEGTAMAAATSTLDRPAVGFDERGALYEAFRNDEHLADGTFAPKGQGVPPGMRKKDTLDQIRLVPVTDIEPENNDRKDFGDLEGLAKSIKNDGLAQPITVRPRPASMGEGPPYVLVAGERRWRATQLTGATEIKAIVKDMTDEEASNVMLVENVMRSDLNAMEEADAYASRMEKYGLTAEQLAERSGVTPHRIKTYLPLRKLAPELQDLVRKGALPFGHAIELVNHAGASLDNNRQILAHRAYNAENLSVAQLRRVVAKLLDQQNQGTMFDADNFMQVEEWSREAKAQTHRISKKGMRDTIKTLTDALAEADPAHPALIEARKILDD